MSAQLRPVAALGLCLAVGLAACTSSGSSATPAGPPESSTSTAAATGRSIDPAVLARSLSRGLAGATSVHLALSTDFAGSVITGAGDVVLADGAISQADITQQLPSGLGTVRLIVNGGRTFAKLPPILVKSGKPWTLLSTSSSNPVVAQLAGTVDSVLAVAAPATLVRLAGAASSARDLGSSTVAGRPATQYSLVVDPSTLPSTLFGGLSSGTARTLPIELWTDASGRPAQARATLQLQGSAVTPTVVLGDYDAPVSITAPAAGSVDG